jgi:hypothetical protein
MTKIVCHIANEPWLAHRGTADHGRVGPGLGEHRPRIGKTLTVAIRGDGDGPIRRRGAKLAAGAAMDGEHGNAFRLRQPCEFRSIDRLLVPAEVHLERDRCDCREAHIDGDHRRAQILGTARRLRYCAGFASSDLHGMEPEALTLGFDLIRWVTTHIKGPRQFFPKL